MTKNEFIGLMKTYISLDKDVYDVHKAIKKLSPNFGGFLLERHNQLFLDTIKYAMDDKNDWISYWIYELDKGKKWTEKSVLDSD